MVREFQNAGGSQRAWGNRTIQVRTCAKQQFWKNAYFSIRMQRYLNPALEKSSVGHINKKFVHAILRMTEVEQRINNYKKILFCGKNYGSSDN